MLLGVTLVGSVVIRLKGSACCDSWVHVQTTALSESLVAQLHPCS
jgi:hypothetical protein